MSSVLASQYSNKYIVFNSNTTPYPLTSFTFNPVNGFGFAFTFKYFSSIQINSTLFFISQSTNTNYNYTSIAAVTNISNFFQLIYSSINTFTLYYQSNNITAMGGRIASVSFTVNPDQIYNIVITYDTTGTPSMKVYIDSVLYSGSTIASPTTAYIPQSGTFNYNFLGGYPQYDGTYSNIIPFVGYVYSFAVYPRTLTQQDAIQTFTTDLSLSTTSIPSTASTLLANPKLSLTYQLSNPNYNTTVSSNIPNFDPLSKSIIFRGQQYLQYSENLNFNSGFTIIIKFQFSSMHIINNETLMTIIQNSKLGEIGISTSSIPLKNSIIIQRYGYTNNLIISFIVANGSSSSSIITNTNFLKGVTYNLIITFDGINSIYIYVNGNLDIQSNLLI